MPARPDGLTRRRIFRARRLALFGGLVLAWGAGAASASEAAAAVPVTRELRISAARCGGAGPGVVLTLRLSLGGALTGRSGTETLGLRAQVTATAPIDCAMSVDLGSTGTRAGTLTLVLHSPGAWTAQLQGSVDATRSRAGPVRRDGTVSGTGTGEGNLSLVLGDVGAPALPRIVLGLQMAAPHRCVVLGAAGSPDRTGRCARGPILVPPDAGSDANAVTPTPAAVSGAEVPAPWVHWGYAAAAPVSATYSAPAFHTLAHHLNLEDTRLVIPFDTLATARDGRCVASDASAFYTTGETWATALQRWLAAVGGAGDVPLISLGWGAATRTDSGAPLDEQNLSPSDAAYRCGLSALMTTTSRWASARHLPAVHEWEVFNEPDIKTCASLAASYYVMALALDHRLRRRDTLVAGAFRDWDDPFLGGYGKCGTPGEGDAYIPDYLAALEHDGVWPRVFSLHPFVDVSASGAEETGDLSVQVSDTLRELNAQPEPAPAVWLTESGVWLENEVGGPTGLSFGAQLDGDPLRQAWGAVGFLHLADSAGQAYRGQVARIYWYEFQPDGDGVSPGSAAFDSGLMGISAPDWSESGRYDPADGEYAVPRASYCVLAFGDTPAAAVVDPRCDWTTAPHDPATDWEVPQAGG